MDLNGERGTAFAVPLIRSTNLCRAYAVRIWTELPASAAAAARIRW
jgi:hypothetical protein